MIIDIRKEFNKAKSISGQIEGSVGENAYAMPPVSALGVSKPMNDATLFDEIHRFLGRFVAYPDENCHVAHALWIVHCHLMDVWDTTPRIAFLSPEPGSGKTRALEVSELLVPNPVEAVNVSAAYLFRRVADPEGLPTILFDEVDTVFGHKAQAHEDIRGLLNAGHRRGAVAGRCVVRGKAVEIEELPAYCAVALAGLGDLPDTLMSRCVVIRMRRRRPDETVEPYRRRLHSPEGHALRADLVAWAEQAAPALMRTYPEIPASITDRDADVWEPLIAVADAVGENWPKRARVAAVALVAQSKESAPSLGVRLLADLREIFGDDSSLSTEEILRRLHEMSEAPWADLKGTGLNDRGLAARLRHYQVRPKDIRYGERVVRGYSREDLHDPWSRYLGPSSENNATSATSATSPEISGPPVADVADVAHSAVTNLDADIEREAIMGEGST